MAPGIKNRVELKQKPKGIVALEGRGVKARLSLCNSMCQVGIFCVVKTDGDRITWRMDINRVYAIDTKLKQISHLQTG